jgi:ADP-heptose:LPS heptosyltransferase
MELDIPTEVQRVVDAMLDMNGIAQAEPFIAIAPGASCDARRYEPRRYAQCVRMLADATGLRIVLVGSERERTLTREIAKWSGNPAVNLAGDLDIPGLAAVIARASLLLCNNSAPLHIAAAFGRPTVVLYSGTDAISQWAPPAPNVAVLSQPTPCAPCYAFNCPYHKECLDVPARDVADAGLRLIASRERAHLEERVAWAG